MENLVAVDEDDDWTEDEEDGDVELGAQQAGAVFKAEMWATDFFLGNWMYIVAVLVTLLISIFVYGQYISFARTQQLGSARAVAQKEIKLPVSVGELATMKATGQPVDDAKVLEVAKALEEVEATDAAKAEALVKAAELYRIAGKTDEQRRVLDAVVATGVEPFAPLAQIALSNLDLEADQADAATTRLKTLSARGDYLGEQAAIDLGMMFEHLGNPAEAKAVYDDFEKRFKESPRLEAVKKRRDALGDG